MRTRLTSLIAVVGCVVAVGGCSNSAEAPSAASTGTPAAHLTVFAAASLKSTFTELGEKFEAAHPGSTVEFSFGGSSDLATQLTNGAPGDIFASADANNMAKVADAGLVAGKPTNFASNTLTIVTAPGNPKGIKGFGDLTADGLLVVSCAPQVPCGSATTKVEAATGVDVQPVSEEQAVSDVLNKVVTGQADAGLVYVTDARSAGKSVTAVDFPEASQAVNTYPIAVLAESGNATAATEFVELVTGPEGRKTLHKAGFASP